MKDADFGCVLRLEQLASLYVHKNNLQYLPLCLTNISTLRMVVVSGDELTCVPTKLCNNPDIKYINTEPRGFLRTLLI